MEHRIARGQGSRTSAGRGYLLGVLAVWLGGAALELLALVAAQPPAPLETWIGAIFIVVCVAACYLGCWILSWWAPIGGQVAAAGVWISLHALLALISPATLCAGWLPKGLTAALLLAGIGAARSARRAEARVASTEARRQRRSA